MAYFGASSVFILLCVAAAVSSTLNSTETPSEAHFLKEIRGTNEYDNYMVRAARTSSVLNPFTYIKRFFTIIFKTLPSLVVAFAISFMGVIKNSIELVAEKFEKASPTFSERIRVFTKLPLPSDLTT